MNDNLSGVIQPVLISFGITVLLSPVIIPLLRKLKCRQTEREELASHQAKTGTPTMGGLVILIAVILTSLLYIKECPALIPVLFMTVGFGLIGFLDDYLKVVLKRCDGLLPWQKLFLQFGVTLVFALYLVKAADVSMVMTVPFTDGYQWDPGPLAVPILFFAVLGTVNGVNFTDGLDGLASGVTVLVAAFFTVAAVGTKSGIAPVTCAVAGALTGFLLYNVYPAKVFMGDTGSLALGGFVVSAAYMLQMPLFILIVGFVYVLEVLSVIIQVGYFKLTHGKRVFRMAPIHHHLELGGVSGRGEGWSETKVVAVFSVATALLCCLGLAAL